MKSLAMNLLAVSLNVLGTPYLLNAQAGDEVAYRNSDPTDTYYERKSEYQYRGRNSGGWRHDTWHGDFDPYQEWGDSWYGISGWDWGKGVGPSPYLGDTEEDKGVPYYYPHYYNANPNEAEIYFDDYYPWGDGQ